MNHRPRLPSISALRAFEAAVRHQSIARAARELNLTDGAVSRAIRELEAGLGFDLFQRGNRFIEPTPVGRDLAVDVSAALDNLSASLERARRAVSSSRPLVLSCEPTFLIRWLIPRVAALQEIVGEVQLVSAGGPVSFTQAGVDLAIRRADFPMDVSVQAEPFLEEFIGPVIRPGASSDVAQTSVDGILLHTATRRDAWNTWATLTGMRMNSTRELEFEHFYQTLQGAAAGVGFAIGPIALVADDLQAGVLRAPWGFVPDGTRYVLMKPKDWGDKAPFDKVLAWLKSEAACLSRFIIRETAI